MREIRHKLKRQPPPPPPILLIRMEVKYLIVKAEDSTRNLRQQQKTFVKFEYVTFVNKSNNPDKHVNYSKVSGYRYFLTFH